VPRVRRPGGAEIYWRVEGEDGPLVVVAPMALHPPGVCAGLIEDLTADSRVLTYDLRGTGRSSRAGHYDMETDVGDLIAVLEEQGEPALSVALGDAAPRTVRVAAARPDLIHTVVVSGETPLGPSSRTGSHEALAGSPAVLQAMIGLLEADYRTGMRTILQASEQGDWDEDSIRARLDATEAHCPPEAGIARMRSWTHDDSLPEGRALGGRLWFVHFPANAWFRGSIDAIRVDLPDACFEEVSDGVISRPAENAAVIRRILSARRAAA
jgi:pimeloyl-ACP methyl ester carboxylesterase